MFKIPLLEKTPWPTATTESITSIIYGIIIALVLKGLLNEKIVNKS